MLYNIFVHLLWCLLVSVCSSVNNPNHSPSDPSVPDETDLSIIDSFLKTVDKNKTNQEDNPNRGALNQPTLTTDVGKSPSLNESDTNLLPQQFRQNATTTTQQSPTNTGNGGKEACQCVKYYMCNVVLESNATKVNLKNDSSHNPEYSSSQEILGVVDIRKAELRNNAINSTLASNATIYSNGTGDCADYLDVCCPLKQIKPPANNTHDNSTGQNLHTASTTSPPETPQGYYHTYCGRRNENGVGIKVTGATQGEAQFGEFPWSVAVIQLEPLEDNPNVTVNKYIGGGSLLHPRVVLTVAHNVLGKSRTTLKVRLGEWDTQTNDEPYPSQDRQVKKTIVHEQFVKTTLFNDVALLILEEEARFAPNVDTVCLPPPNNQKLRFEGQLCYSAGWGKDHFGAEGRYAEILKKVQVPIVPKDTCQQQLSSSEKLPGFRLHNSFMCAGGTGEDTCKGDGGSALVCSLSDKNHTHYVEVGAVSWGIGCRNKQFPAVYSDITLLTPWILKQMEKEGFSTEYCTIRE